MVCIILAKVRRLYDIANVLTSLRLIEKIHLVQTRKPAFKWMGADVFPLQSSAQPEAYTLDQPQTGIQTKEKPKREKRKTGIRCMPHTNPHHTPLRHATIHQ